MLNRDKKSLHQNENFEFFKEFFVSVFGSSKSHTKPQCLPIKFNFIRMNENEVQDVLQKLDLLKSVDRDKLENLVLQQSYQNLRKFLALIFQNFPLKRIVSKDLEIKSGQNKLQGG